MVYTETPLEAYVRWLKSADFGDGILRYQKSFRPQEAVYGALSPPLPPALAVALKHIGIRQLYRHQKAAVEAVRQGLHVVVASPTASGKSLVYNLPVIENCLKRPDARALYLFPLKALAQDQLSAFNTLAEAIPGGPIVPKAAVYDGDTTPWHRRRIRSAPPQVLVTNPDMLHLGILAHHHQWAVFFQGLETVVVDEVHTLRGLLGSHMTQVFHRLQRICRHYGARPTFIFCSATVANPRNLTETLTGLPVVSVSGKSARRGARHLMLVDPTQSLVTCVIRLFEAAVNRGLRTVVYTQSRKLTEWIGLRIRDVIGDMSNRVGVYRAGLLPEERRRVESQLADGELLAVVATSALELGIDIGDLDLCILAGYPGTLISTWQRAGRVGRKGQPSALVLVAGEDALDQYFMRHPGELIRRQAEAAVVNPLNTRVLEQHLPCAAAELPLERGEVKAFPSRIRAVVRQLVGTGLLMVSGDGQYLYSAKRAPHRDVDLRGGASRWQIRDAANDDPVGEIDGGRVFREAHPGAVYLHGGTVWEVERLDFEKRIAFAKPARPDYHTRTRGWKNTEIVAVNKHKRVFNADIYFGNVKVSDQVTGYEKRQIGTGRSLGIVPLELPIQTFETEALWLIVPDAVRSAVEAQMHHFMGAIHALEHAMIGMLPLLVLTDRNDLGGIAMPYHPQVRSAAVFIYDGVDGGAGFSRGGFEAAGELLKKTAGAIDNCPCDTGCPSCVHSPKCGSGNRPIDKAGAGVLIKQLLQGIKPGAITAPPPSIIKPSPPRRAQTSNSMPGRFGVFDIETQKSAAEVGGWHHAHRMRVSCAVLYDSADDRFYTFDEDGVDALVSHLKRFELVVGFNILKFDYRVLSAYTRFRFQNLPTLDLLETIRTQLGYRLSLDHLARETLGVSKTADGLKALQWWKERRIQEIIDYCRSDVKITRDLYCFGRRHGYLLFRNKAGQQVRAPARWSPKTGPAAHE